MLTNGDIWNIALQQSANDMGCSLEDFLSNENVAEISHDDIEEKAEKMFPTKTNCRFSTAAAVVVANWQQELW